MAKADADHTVVATALDIQWAPLADIYRHAVSASLSRRPEAEIRSEIFEAMHSGRLPNLVKRAIRYPLASRSELPPMKVTHNELMPSEVLAIGVAGRGSLHVDWQNCRATRRAGRARDRIEFDGIWCSRAHALALWPIELTPEPVATAPVAEMPKLIEAVPTDEPQVAPISAGDEFYTGGRPSAARIVKQEAARRISDGEVKPQRGGLNQFARDLRSWWEKKRQSFEPPAPSMSIGTVENTIRDLWKRSLGEHHTNPTKDPTKGP